MLIVGLWFVIVWAVINIVAAVFVGLVSAQATKKIGEGCAKIVVTTITSGICIWVAAEAISALS